MSKCQIILIAVAVSACASARPLERLTPVYPDAIRTANARGQVIARIGIARTGEVQSIKVLNESSSGGLLEASVGNTVRKARFTPARAFGVSRSSQLEYVFDFVLFRPTRVLGTDERWVGVDNLPTRCPGSQKERHVIICGEVVPTVSKSVF